MLHLKRRRLVPLVERDELRKDVIALPRRRMVEDLAASHHLKADAAEAHRDAHADESRGVLACGPARPQSPTPGPGFPALFAAGPTPDRQRSCDDGTRRRRARRPPWPTP